MINRIKRWNEWRKYNANSLGYKLMVLIGLAHSPTFDLFF